jgi:mannose-6-phosphate isomerase-like protein (cupin superfamily)
MMSTDLQPAAQPLWFLDNLVYVHIDDEESGGAYSLAELWAPRDSMPPLHVHHRDDETFYVLEGEVRMFVGDRQIVVPAGQAALGPREVAHTYRVESDQARFIVINSPAGFEQFLRAAGEPAPRAELPPSGRPADPAALAKAAAEYGIEILGPPGMLPTEA